MAHNVTHSIEGDELVVRMKIDRAAFDAAPLSGKGKSVIVAKHDYEPLPIEVQGMTLSLATALYAKLPR